MELGSEKREKLLTGVYQQYQNRKPSGCLSAEQSLRPAALWSQHHCSASRMVMRLLSKVFLLELETFWDAPPGAPTPAKQKEAADQNTQGLPRTMESSAREARVKLWVDPETSGTCGIHTVSKAEVQARVMRQRSATVVS